MSSSQCEGYSPKRIQDFSSRLGVIVKRLREVEDLLGYDEWTGPELDRRHLVEVQESLKHELNSLVRDHSCFLVSLSSLDEAKRWKDWTKRSSSLKTPFDLNKMPAPAKHLVSARTQAKGWLDNLAVGQSRIHYIRNHIWQNRLPYTVSFVLGFATNLLTNLIC